MIFTWGYRDGTVTFFKIRSKTMLLLIVLNAKFTFKKHPNPQKSARTSRKGHSNGPHEELAGIDAAIHVAIRNTTPNNNNDFIDTLPSTYLYSYLTYEPLHTDTRNNYIYRFIIGHRLLFYGSGIHLILFWTPIGSEICKLLYALAGLIFRCQNA